jgi:hypothetical protein
MYMVEVFRGGDGLAAPLHQMRTWLDGMRIQPVALRLSIIPDGTIFRVEFRLASEAAAFAEALDGKVSVEPADRSLAA